MRCYQLIPSVLTVSCFRVIVSASNYHTVRPRFLRDAVQQDAKWGAARYGADQVAAVRVTGVRVPTLALSSSHKSAICAALSCVLRGGCLVPVSKVVRLRRDFASRRYISCLGED